MTAKRWVVEKVRPLHLSGVPYEGVLEAVGIRGGQFDDTLWGELKS